MTITLDDIRDQLRRHSPGKQDNHAYALPMVAAMEERAEVDAAYTIALYQWLANGSSILLRDALCRVFANDDFVLIPAMGFIYPWEECWTAIDSAWGAVAFEKGIAPAATEEATTAPADEAPEGCDDEGCPHYGTPHGHPARAPGARTDQRKALHDLIVDAVAEALQMQGDGTGDHMRGLQSLYGPNTVCDPVAEAKSARPAKATSLQYVVHANPVEAMHAALGRMIYETTSLSPMKANGDHDCTIRAETLELARAAYHAYAEATK